MAPYISTGEWATGDGVKLATAVGAANVDLEHVQLHPTAFVDPVCVRARVMCVCVCVCV